MKFRDIVIFTLPKIRLVVTHVMLCVLSLTICAGYYFVCLLSCAFPWETIFSMITDPKSPFNAVLWLLYPEADRFFHHTIFISLGAVSILLAFLLLSSKGPTRYNFSIATLLISSGSPDFFSRTLFSPMSSQHLQTYYSLTVYFFLAFALCGLLAGLAYLFSISTAQETEKRSEYECGFAPFDSATRLPFDVHFYLVGILFLIFDVEVALLFPWVLALRTTGWFSFYLMLAFLATLSLGFLYEWKRGALIWPTRYSKKNFSPLSGLLALAQGETARELFDILFYSPAFVFVAVFALHRLARVYTWVHRSKSKYVPREKALAALWFTAAMIFLASLFYSYYLSLALVVVFFVSSYLEMNPFWPARAYWWARVLLFSFPSRFEKRPYRALRFFWGAVLALCVFVAAVAAYNFAFSYTASYAPQYKVPFGFEVYFTSETEALLHRGWDYIVYLFYRWLPAFHFLPFTPATFVLGAPFVAFARLADKATTFISPYNMLALLLIFWMLASVATSYVYGATSFVIRGTLYEKRAGDPSVSENMRYLWTESLFLIALTALAAFFYLVDWDLIASVVNALLLSARMDIIDGFYDLIARILSAPADTFNLLHRSRMYLVAVATTVGVLLAKLWVVLKPVLVFLWTYKPFTAWLLFATRGMYHTLYIHRDETESAYGKFICVTSAILYTYVMPFLYVLYFCIDTYNWARTALAPYFVKYKDAATAEQPARITDSSKVESNETKTFSIFAVIIVGEHLDASTGLDYQTTEQNILNAQELGCSLMNGVASAQIYCEDLHVAVNLLAFMAICLLLRFAQLAVRWLNRTPLPAYAPAELVKKFAWAPRKAFICSLLFSTPELAKIEGTYCPSAASLDYVTEDNTFLSSWLAAVEKEASVLYATAALLACCCTLLFIANCLLSRMCQHHYQQLNGILTYGALTVIPQATASRRAAKAVLFSGGVSAVELLAPTQTELTSVQLAEFPLVAELLVFILICGVITKLSFDLGKEHNKRTLAFSSWRVLSTGLFAAVFIYAYQFIFDGGSASVLSGYFATSRTITLLKLVTLVSAVFVLDASETFMRQHSRHLLEYPIMVALTTLFMLLLVSANHIMSAFLSLVGFSLGLYVLILYDANRRPSREAGLKYYYLSTLSSGFILYGILLVYTLTGTGNFDELFLLLNTKVQFQESALLRTALLLILAGFFFKLSAFPGHLWAADVYEGSPAPVTAFFMLPVKIVVLGAFIRLFSVALAPLAAYWLPFLTVAVVVSIVWGAFASVQEKKIRRFLAYASINQMGFLLMGLTTDSDEGYQAALLYIGVYAVMTCAFLTIFLSARRQDGSELLYVSDFRTLASRNWLVGWSLAVVLFSMAGIPPLGGFFAKYLVLLHAFEKNLIIEVVVGLATSLVSTYYYLRIIKILKFEQPDGAMPSAPCLTPRRQNQLFTAEALLWSFILFAPASLSLTYALAFTQGPACLVV